MAGAILVVVVIIIVLVIIGAFVAKKMVGVIVLETGRSML